MITRKCNVTMKIHQNDISKQYISNITKSFSENTQNIFQYLWQCKIEPIARKTIFQRKKIPGGLNIKELEANDYAMRLRHKFILKEQQNPPI